MDRGAAVEVEEAGAGLLGDDLEGRQVPRLGRELDPGLGAARDHERRVLAAAHAADRPVAGHVVDDRVRERRAREIGEGRQAEHGPVAAIDGGDADPALAAEGAPAAHGPVELALGRQVADADDDLAVRLETDQVAPGRKAADEIARAVDRVHDPATAAAPGVARTLLAQEAVVGKGRAQLAHDQPLALAVGHGDRRVVRLVLGRDALRRVRQRQLTRPACDASGRPRSRVPRACRILALDREPGSPGCRTAQSPVVQRPWTKRRASIHRFGFSIHARGSAEPACAVTDCAVKRIERTILVAQRMQQEFTWPLRVVGPPGFDRPDAILLEVNDEPSPREASAPRSGRNPGVSAARGRADDARRDLGTVRDASGAIVPGATVTVTNVDTNATRSVVTDAQGFYRVPALEPGTYTIRTELSGFQTVENREVRLVAAGEVTLNVEMKVAGVGEAITVVGRADAVELNKTSPTIGTTIDGAPGRRAAALGRPQHQQPDGGRPEREPRGRPGHLRGQRPALAQQQLHDRRLGQQRRQRHDRDDAGRARVGGRVPGADERLQRRVRPQQRRAGQRDHQVGHATSSAARSGTTSGPTAWPRSRTSRRRAGSRSRRDYTRHQAGASIGGPIIKDKTFFFALYQYDGDDPARCPGTTVRIPTQSGFAALAGVPLRAGQSASSRQAVLDRLSFLNEVYAQNPAFRSSTPRSSTACRSRPGRPTSTS